MKAKKTICIMLALLLLALGIYGGFAYAGGTDELYIKVGLYYGSTGMSSVKISSADGFVLATATEDGPRTVKSLESYNNLVIELSSGKAVLKDDGGTIISSELASDMAIMSAAKDEDSRLVTINGSAYRDGVQAVASASSGLLSVINYVSLEHYVWGVLNNEMSYSYPVEALKAQAVAARSYAIDNMGKHKKYGFDICTTTDCQVYKGVASEHDETTVACEQTAGLVMTYDGKAISGYYSANSGGYTMNSEDVWYAALGYLRAVKDPFSPTYSWNTSATFEELKAKLEKSGYKPGKIKSVSVGSRYENGAVATLVITGSDDTVTLSKENVRIVLGSSIIKSVRFSMGASELPEILEAGGSGGVTLLGANGAVTRQDAVSVLGADGETVASELSGLSVYDGESTTELSLSGSGGDTVFTDEVVTTGTVYFNGLGLGHGVGMPQSSAKAMANAGYDFKDILQYYYTNIEIVPFSEAE